MSYPSPPSDPEQLTAIVREQFMLGASTDVLAEHHHLDRREIQRMTRGLAKQRPLSDDDIARFWSRVDTSGGPDACWRWLGGTAKGRGQFVAQETTHQAHRVAYTITYGPIPAGKVVLQSCDDWLCVNPAHLVLSRPITSDARGEDHPLARLSARQAGAVRTIRAAGVPYRVIGDLIGLNESTIRKIVAGKRYADAPQRAS